MDRLGVDNRSTENRERFGLQYPGLSGSIESIRDSYCDQIPGSWWNCSARWKTYFRRDRLMFVNNVLLGNASLDTENRPDRRVQAAAGDGEDERGHQPGQHGGPQRHL